MATADLTAAELPATKPAMPHHHVAAVVIGNSLEFYDFLTYSFFAIQIGRTFFPSDNPVSSLLASLAGFWCGFLTRPIGAFFIGRIADRLGRKPAMLLSFGLMGAAMLGIGLTPSFKQIGFAAPVLLVLFRLVQGFALGGELGSSTAYMLEAAPPRRRGFYVSLQYMGQDAAVLVAGVFGVLLSSNMSAGALDSWGWRIPFIVGAMIVPFGLLLRRTLTESLTLPHDEPGESHSVRGYVRLAALGLVMLASGTIVSYTFTYMTTYAENTLHMATNLAFGATVATGLVGVMLDPVGGMISDRFGRKPIMIGGWIVLGLLALPGFWIISHYRTGWALVTVTAGLSALSALAAPSVLIAITESLPRRVRASGLGLIYAFAIMTFGGSAQFVVTWLSDLTKDPLTPAYYMMAAVAVGVVAMLILKETAPVKVDKASV